MSDHTITLRKQLADMLVERHLAGGRSSDLDDEINEVTAKLRLAEEPLTLEQAALIVAKVAEHYVETVGYPNDDDVHIDKDDHMRCALIDAAISMIRRR